MKSVQQEVDERSNLTGSNKFEMLLFKLGGDANGCHSELYGINVFKIREIVAMPPVTQIAEGHPHMMGVVNLRGQVLPVVNLPAVIGCTPVTGLNILLVTEFARTTQAFAVESVEEIVRMAWEDVLPASMTSASARVTSIARVDGNVPGTRLAQVLDVETILRDLSAASEGDDFGNEVGVTVRLKPGSVILAADDSVVARAMLEQTLAAMGTPYIMTKSGKEAWERLQLLHEAARAEGKTVQDKVALVLSDLEMPEMDGFTLTRNIKSDARFKSIPVVIHSSLSGAANEMHIERAGADAYVAKFQADELSATIRRVLGL
jgi:two-component system chemotaxis response regulator CheV